MFTVSSCLFYNKPTILIQKSWITGFCISPSYNLFIKKYFYFLTFFLLHDSQWAESREHKGTLIQPLSSQLYILIKEEKHTNSKQQHKITCQRISEEDIHEKSQGQKGPVLWKVARKYLFM